MILGKALRSKLNRALLARKHGESRSFLCFRGIIKFLPIILNIGFQTGLTREPRLSSSAGGI